MYIKCVPNVCISNIFLMYVYQMCSKCMNIKWCVPAPPIWSILSLCKCKSGNLMKSLKSQMNNLTRDPSQPATHQHWITLIYHVGWRLTTQLQHIMKLAIFNANMPFLMKTWLFVLIKEKEKHFIWTCQCKYAFLDVYPRG